MQMLGSRSKGADSPYQSQPTPQAAPQGNAEFEDDIPF